MTTAALRGSDRILSWVKWLSASIVPFLVVAAFLLYVLPTRTDELFAWTIAPPLSAMFLASAYLGGVWFFAQVIRQRAWHRVRSGFPAVVLFATLAAVATFLHWDRFHFGHLSFIVWVVLYVTTPFLTLAALLVNARADTGTAEPHDIRIPVVARVVLAGVGILALIVGLVLFVDPLPLIDAWAWPLTPLTARIVGAILTLPGAVNMWMLLDARWSAFRAIIQASIFSLIFLNIAWIVCRDQLLGDRIATPALTIGLSVSLLVYLGFYIFCERRARASTTTSPRSPGRP